jgi:hypothetical protein
MIQTVNLCDICMKQDDKEVKSTWSETITIGNLTREIMLCDNHTKVGMAISDLKGVLNEFGTKPHTTTTSHPKAKPSAKPGKPVEFIIVEEGKRPRAAEEPRPCKVKGCKFVAKTGGGLASHERIAHGVNNKVKVAS